MNTIWNTREWIDNTEYYFRRYRQGTKAFLAEADWDDIQQELITHIWTKRALYDDSRPAKPWIKTVVIHFVTNKIRNIIGNIKSPINIAAKRNLMFAESIDVAYSIIDPTLEIKEPTAEEFYTVLNDLEQKVLACALDQKTVIETAQVINRKPSYVYEIKQNIRKKYKSFL